MRWAIATACLISTGIGVALLIRAPDVTRLPPGGRSILYIGVIIAWGFVAVGAFAHARRPDNRTGRLMVMTGTLVAVTGLQFFDEPVLFAIGALFDTASISALVHLLIAFPSGRVEGRWPRRAVVAAYAAAALQLPALLVTSCGDCPAGNPWLVLDSDVLSALFTLPQVTLLLFMLVSTLVVLIGRRQAASPLLRRGLEPVLLLGAAILVLGVATVFAISFDAGITQALQIASFSAFALVPAAFLLGLVRTRFFRTAAVGRVIERLSLDPRGIRDALAIELSDPTLDVLYWVDGGYVHRDGRPAEATTETLTEIDHEGRRVGALTHSAALNEEPELLREAAAAAALALENQRLEVELRARLEALRASRARLVEAGDAERRRLGRDLHDGAQQRLVALMIELQLAREHFESDPANAKGLIDSAFANAQEAVHELRDLAAGIHPAVLSQRGLDAALESLASRSTVPVELESDLAERLPSPVETAAYFVVAEALTNVAKYAHATHAKVEVRRENGHAVIDIRDDGIGGADTSTGSGLRGLSDRVGALDGALEIHSPTGAGTHIRAVIPT
ncbi:histidine kinase [Solirubrobacter phytolaccae]|uniref:histidine kinase n=1 Tax=Solirubrobacter phytolaccae TaxID=1404360 RepID=A0A9X3S7V2_9ACTN|nr:histidine kinase [Solirubrobacter phytolaccae]MDA0181459.1 histidine kinase [Solirubrobacter phytolaccae]